MFLNHHNLPSANKQAPQERRPPGSFQYGLFLRFVAWKYEAGVADRGILHEVQVMVRQRVAETGLHADHPTWPVDD